MTDRGLCHILADAMAALAEGRFDEITPQVMAEVERHLNECPDCAARLGTAAPGAGDLLHVEARAPSAAEWALVWQRIDGAAQQEAHQRRRHRLGHGMRPWMGLSAAAALLATAGLWQWHESAGRARWDLRFAGPGEAAIESLEVFGDATAFVLSAGDDGAASIIWVMENGET